MVVLVLVVFVSVSELEAFESPVFFLETEVVVVEEEAEDEGGCNLFELVELDNLPLPAFFSEVPLVLLFFSFRFPAVLEELMLEVLFVPPNLLNPLLTFEPAFFLPDTEFVGVPGPVVALVTL